MKIFSILCLSLLTLAVNAAEVPYNEAADAKLDIQQALTEAITNNKPVIVVFGANWCPDCKMLDRALKAGTVAPLIAQDFRIVKVSVGDPVNGRFEKNADIAKSYGVPLEKGIPTVVILSTNSTVLYVTRNGELASARKMGDTGIYEFFKRVTASPALKK